MDRFEKKSSNSTTESIPVKPSVNSVISDDLVIASSFVCWTSLLFIIVRHFSGSENDIREINVSLYACVQSFRNYERFQHYCKRLRSWISFD